MLCHTFEPEFCLKSKNFVEPLLIIMMAIVESMWFRWCATVCASKLWIWITIQKTVWWNASTGNGRSTTELNVQYCTQIGLKWFQFVETECIRCQCIMLESIEAGSLVWYWMYVSSVTREHEVEWNIHSITWNTIWPLAQFPSESWAICNANWVFLSIATTTIFLFSRNTMLFGMHAHR